MEQIRREIQRQTGQPVEYFCPIGSGIGRLGNLSFLFTVALNPGIKPNWEFGTKFIKRCGGTAYYCDIWVSLLLPVYFLDINSLSYDESTGVWQAQPYIPKNLKHKKIINLIHKIFRNLHYQLLSHSLSSKRVSGVRTRLKNKPTIYDCLFSDLFGLSEGMCRHLDPSISDCLPGSDLYWSERIDRKGHYLERSIYLNFDSGDHIQIDLDDKIKVAQIKLITLSGANRKVTTLKRRK
jgi:hypothetical protein